MKTQVMVMVLLAAATTMAQRGPEDERKAPHSGDFITRLDLDADGAVSLEEFDGPDEHFADLDRNGDGYIDADEAPSGPPPCKRKGKKGERNRERGSRGGSLIERLDQDGDGQVSQDEFDGPTEHFERIDQNGDGYIDKAEASKRRPRRERKARN